MDSISQQMSAPARQKPRGFLCSQEGMCSPSPAGEGLCANPVSAGRACWSRCAPRQGQRHSRMEFSPLQKRQPAPPGPEQQHWASPATCLPQEHQQDGSFLPFFLLLHWWQTAERRPRATLGRGRMLVGLLLEGTPGWHLKFHHFKCKTASRKW